MKLLPLLLLFIITNSFAQDTLVPYRVGNKWGYADYQGNIKIQPQYDEVDFLVKITLVSKFRVLLNTMDK